jgi:hypothetical protein
VELFEKAYRDLKMTGIAIRTPIIAIRTPAKTFLY